MSYGGEGEVGFATARGRDWPQRAPVQCFSGKSARRLARRRAPLRDYGYSHRFAYRRRFGGLCHRPHCAERSERAYEIFKAANLPITESDLLVVQLPEGKQPLLEICKGLLKVEIGIHYAYPLLVGPLGNAALALRVENHETAAQTLQSQGFTLLSENDFR